MTSHDQIGYWILGFVNPMLGIFAAKNFILPPSFPPPPPTPRAPKSSQKDQKLKTKIRG